MIFPKFSVHLIKAYKFKKKEDNLYYTVNKGDNLYLISKKYNVTISKLIELIDYLSCFFF